MTIIGGGPAGMFAAFYAGMRQASVKIIDSMPQLGGQPIALYPEKFIYDIAGFPKTTAAQLTQNLEEQMSMFPVEICLKEKVQQVIKRDERHFEIITDKSTHYSKSVIVTAGVGAFEPRRLDLLNAERYEGKNLYYFVKDLKQFANQHVIINGGGDSAVDWALMLEPIAQEVTLIHRRDKFRAHEHSVMKLMASKVKVITSADITELHGDEQIEEIAVHLSKTGETLTISCDALIVNFGFVSSIGPIAEWGLDVQKGSIVVDTRMETSIPGIFAAGDITTYPGKVKLIAVGFGEAPTAVNNAKVYIDPTARLSPGHSSNLKL
ncbi:ferredoxin--NADP(+) reductase [Bacillus sp. FJAT-27264]|uniref:NAD(P)/FAD-dependent oxidoreductase n=1 Tax=Paenibacillus sp. (strain DSM 101736 / FJAT-27264) TaxID=1850362 RepID=UPI000807D592|nr:NAD(P)/FAD-dependent oxidoreductase [Bacillus sp. FJAT-27264]OBZ19648.1 ferredoxin--NADP(+) reductase [Bacillus sp. FJAT-27264]